MPNDRVDVDSRRSSACYPRSTFYPLSDGATASYRRITKSCFRTCSARRPRSQAPFCLCARWRGCRPRRGHLRAPPLSFGRKPPQSNWPPGVVPRPVSGPGLGDRPCGTGVSLVAPPPLTRGPPSLPATLHAQGRSPAPGCSEGSQGLSVLLRVPGICTGTTTSPRSSSRQCRDRCRIRAGRNLPDKEFRYLRTVIVTADIHRGFGSALRLAADASP